MDIGDNGGDLGGGVGGFEDEKPKPQRRQLPDDLPKSLDDRRHVPTHYTAETEMYDAWQGQSQFLTAPVLAKPLQFNSLSLDDQYYEDDVGAQKNGDSDARLMEMLAAQERHREESGNEDEDSVARSTTLSEDEKKDILQKAMTTAAVNGDIERLERILKGPATEFVDINARDDEGAPPLVYASCFGHIAIVEALLSASVDVDKQDKNQWTALMWASTNGHKGITKVLLDHGASPVVTSASGRTRTAFDFVQPESDLTGYLHDSGYRIGSVGVMNDDFYNAGFSDQKFEDEVANGAEERRRMMMTSARDLEVDLGNMGMDDQPEPEDDDFEEEAAEFNWTKCLHDQMFVFQEGELERILDIIITEMKPQRSPSQKPVPANMIFLCARYAHYHANPELLAKLLIMATDKINDVVETHQWDMTILAFWQSNATLLLHYLKKDAGLGESTSEFQLQLAELVNEIFILIIRDAERRMDKVLTQAMLDHESIVLDDIAFQNEWKLFKRKAQVKEVPFDKQFRPPSPTARAKPSPRNITSLLSSTLFVLDLYDIHSVITSQILAQLLYWLGTELYNRIMADRKYLARSKAMNILMNVNAITEWARNNNRQPEHYEHGSMTSSGENTIEAANRHFQPLIQLLQWLQVITATEGDDLTKFVETVQQFTRLTPQQLIHAVKHYRPEVGEPGLPKTALKYLQNQQIINSKKRQEKQKSALTPTTPIKPAANGEINAAATPTNGQVVPAPEVLTADEEDEQPDSILRDPALMLPFQLPSSTDMLVSYGAGFGGVNRERERKYIPTVPPEFLARLDQNGGRAQSTFDERDWENEDLSG